MHYPTCPSPMTLSTNAMNMYALHEHGESHDENSEHATPDRILHLKKRIDNMASPEDLPTADEAEASAIEDDYANPNLSKGNSVNFNLDGLKEMLKCANCHR